MREQFSSELRKVTGRDHKTTEITGKNVDLLMDQQDKEYLRGYDPKYDQPVKLSKC